MENRIVTSHTGSLPRPQHLVETMLEKVSGRPVDELALSRQVEEAVAEVVARQREIGIDVISDGEVGKRGFSNYVQDRFGGFSGEAVLDMLDVEEFPGLHNLLFGDQQLVLSRCTSELTLEDPDAVFEDVRRFEAALGEAPSPDVAFMNAPTPGQLSHNFPNAYYDSHEDYLAAAGQILRHEYKAITDAGFALQLDSPDLAMASHMRVDGTEIDDFQGHVSAAIDALNLALEGIPAEQVRLHVCWGNYGGPHHLDMPLEKIIDRVLDANVSVFSFEAANPRHAHEHEVFERVKLPAGKKIMPGLIDVTTNRIEHPRLVSERIVRFAQLVGPENVIAGTDCGLGTIVGWDMIDPNVGWRKLESLVEGAKLASEELYG